MSYKVTYVIRVRSLFPLCSFSSVLNFNTILVLMKYNSIIPKILNNYGKGMKGNLDNNSIEKLIRFGAIPFIIVILIIIILSIDHSGTGKEDSLSELPVVSLAGGVTQDPSMTREDNNENLNDNNETQSLESTDQVSEADETESKSSNPSETITDPSQYPLQQDALLELTGLIQSYCEAKEEIGRAHV